MKKQDVIRLVVELAKKKHTSAMIGTILRDTYGIPDVKAITGKSVSKIMEENKVYGEYPEDLMSLFKRAIRLHEHLLRNKADKTSKKGMENLESKIRRLIKYYKRVGKLKSDFKYDLNKIKLIVEK